MEWSRLTWDQILMSFATANQSENKPVTFGRNTTECYAFYLL